MVFMGSAYPLIDVSFRTIVSVILILLALTVWFYFEGTVIPSESHICVRALTQFSPSRDYLVPKRPRVQGPKIRSISWPPVALRSLSHIYRRDGDRYWVNRAVVAKLLLS